MDKNSDILKIVKEDILRILAEAGEAVMLDSIRDELRTSDKSIFKAVDVLKKDVLISINNNFLSLTEKGDSEAVKILERHLFLERYFKDIKNKKEAHRISHIIEHYISEEVIDNLKKLSTFKGDGKPLIEFKEDKGFITDIDLGTQLFERIISIGIFPGERIEVMFDLPNGIIIKVRNKKIFIPRKIASNIKVLSNEKN
jgi:Mn-dependent DtxR family transcriptional regulator